MFQRISSIITPFLGRKVGGKFDTPHPPQAATSPTRGEVVLTILPNVSRETNVRCEVRKPLPLWERSPLAAGEGSVFTLTLKVFTRT